MLCAFWAAMPAAAAEAEKAKRAEDSAVWTKTSVERAEFETRSIVLRDGAILAYYVRPGDGPVLVLVPETNGDRAQYFTDAFLTRIDPAFRLVVIETRGQGRSWPPPTAAQASIENYADDVLQVVHELGLPAWYLAGHSLGGMIAIEVAGRAPAGLRGIVSLEGWVHSRVSDGAFVGAAQADEAQRIEARRQREARYLSHRWTKEEYGWLTGMWRKWLRGEAIMAGLDIPVLAVFGDRDLEKRPGRDRLLLPDRDNVELVWIEHSSHYVTGPLYAGKVAEAINAFIRKIEVSHTPRVIGQQIVFKEQNRFGGWPANNGAWHWGDEFLVGFSVPWHQSQDPARHQIDRTRSFDNWFARSLDGGETWVIEKPDAPHHADVALAQCRPLGKPMDFSTPGFALTVRFHKAGLAYFYFSTDKGHIWKGPFSFPDLGTPGIQARTDYLVHGPRELTVFLTANKSNGSEGRPLCARTTDGGMTWELLAYIGPEPEGFAIMSSSLQLDAKTFLTTVRMKSAEEQSWIDAWISTDRGRHWNYLNRPVPDAGGSSGNPPDLIELRDGRLALVYGYRSAPRGIRARLSGDRGRTWGAEFVLRDDAVTHDLGYSRSFQRSDGRVVSVYYYNDGLHTERFIAATIWDPGRP